MPPRVPPRVPHQSPPPARAWTPPPAPETTPITPLANRPRGRHRKPRPRKVLLAAGGFALAAGVLSLVRVTPDGEVGGAGRSQALSDLDADPSRGTTYGDTSDDTAADHTGNTAASVGDIPRATPSASAPMGGATPAPTTPAAALPTSLPSTTGLLRHLPLDALPLPTSPAPAADATTIPQQPSTPAPVTSPGRQRQTTPPPAPAAQQPQQSQPQPQPTATPTPTPEPSAPAPQTSTPAGVCVPLIGVCVDPLNHHH
ncbi:hypothetical protein AB0945_12290 [Streptomyces sp. NPDC005474]|uniref:hypothetical protein n=1 Tax=Streptomyces sp. NPDC005474 TaxID=3154878 RepID=UPI0034533397